MRRRGNLVVMEPPETDERRLTLEMKKALANEQSKRTLRDVLDQMRERTKPPA